MLLPIYLFPLILLVHMYIPVSLFSRKILFFSSCAFSYTFTGQEGKLEKPLFRKLSCTSEVQIKLTALAHPRFPRGLF